MYTRGGSRHFSTFTLEIPSNHFSKPGMLPMKCNKILTEVFACCFFTQDFPICTNFITLSLIRTCGGLNGFGSLHSGNIVTSSLTISELLREYKGVERSLANLTYTRYSHAIRGAQKPPNVIQRISGRVCTLLSSKRLTAQAIRPKPIILPASPLRMPASPVDNLTSISLDSRRKFPGGIPF